MCILHCVCVQTYMHFVIFAAPCSSIHSVLLRINLAVFTIVMSTARYNSKKKKKKLSKNAKI